MLRLLFAASLLLALWVMVVLWPQENTLALAAAGKIDFNAAWGYRFRIADLLLTGGNPPLYLQVFRPFGPKILCILLILMHLPPLVRRSPRALIAVGVLAAVISSYLFFTIANPLLLTGRQKVMGGAALLDGIGLGTSGERVMLDENCLAVINPSDLRAISSLELVDKKSAMALPQIRVLDLKVVEKNYRLLTLKDEKGSPLFSDAARAFARAEMSYAQMLQKEIMGTAKLCLIANFDIAPAAETAPFSRARQILDARSTARLDTKVIQLPAGFTRR